MNILSSDCFKLSYSIIVMLFNYNWSKLLINILLELLEAEHISNIVKIEGLVQGWRTEQDFDENFVAKARLVTRLVNRKRPFVRNLTSISYQGLLWLPLNSGTTSIYLTGFVT